MSGYKGFSVFYEYIMSKKNSMVKAGRRREDSKIDEAVNRYRS